MTEEVKDMMVPVIKAENLNEEDKKILTELYSQAKEVCELKPWEYLGDLDIVTVELPEASESFFASISGATTNQPAIHLFPGIKAYQSFLRLAAADGEDMERLKYERDHVSLFFAPKTTVPEEQLAIMDALGITVEGDLYPAFFTFMPGFVPRMITIPEAKIMNRVYQHLKVIFSKQKSGEMKASFDTERTIVRYYDIDKNGWETEEADTYYPDLDYQITAVPTEDEAIKDAVKKPRKVETLELDMFYLPTPLASQETETPFYPVMLLLASHEDGKLYYNDMLVKGDAKGLAVFTAITNYVQREGRPKAIIVHQHYLETMISDLCKLYKTDIIFDETTKLNEFKVKLLNSK